MRRLKNCKDILLRLVGCNVAPLSTSPTLTPMKTKQVGKHLPFNEMAEKQWGFEEKKYVRNIKTA